MSAATFPRNFSGNGQPIRVAFCTRISTDEDHQKYSLDAQSERLEAFCKAQYGDDWKLHKLYRDTESGTHMNRPGLEEMLRCLLDNFEKVIAEGPNLKKEAPSPPAREEGAYP